MDTGSRRIPVEVVFTLGMVAALLVLALIFRLPIMVPTSGAAMFMEMHYLLPLVGVAAWALCAVVGQREQLMRTFLIGLPCYAVVLVVHFNIKLMVPHVNPTTWDPLFWSIDQAARPLVDFCIAARKWLRPVLPYEGQAYMISFIALFYISFCYHAVRTPLVFRKLFLAALFLQGLGALAYLPFPALGPFIYENGANPSVTEAQHFMLHVNQLSVAGGPAWLSQNGDSVLLAGLGAMPSLHAGGSFLFLWFAVRHARVLLPTYVPIFAFILMAAIGNRWHYLIDLPVGIALAWLSIHLAYRLDREPAQAAAPAGLQPAAA